MSNRIPDFFIVGAAKSGTTSLWQYLGQHPGIFMTDDIQAKELGYFCHHYGVKDFGEYASYFRNAAPGQRVGESCHAYLSSPESAQMIHDAVSAARIIMVLRNPIDRAYSLYNWMLANGYEPAFTFEMALEMEKKRLEDPAFIGKNPHGFYMNHLYVHSGMYAAQVKRYFDVFGKENCLVVLFDELKKDGLAVTKRVFDFLGVDPGFSPVIEIHNESQVLRFPRLQFFFQFELRWRLTKMGMARLRAVRLTNKLMRLNTIDKKPAPMKPSTREQLRRQLTADILQTGELIGKDLSNWLK